MYNHYLYRYRYYYNIKLFEMIYLLYCRIYWNKIIFIIIFWTLNKRLFIKNFSNHYLNLEEFFFDKRWFIDYKK